MYVYDRTMKSFFFLHSIAVRRLRYPCLRLSVRRNRVMRWRLRRFPRRLFFFLFPAGIDRDHLLCPDLLVACVTKDHACPSCLVIVRSSRFVDAIPKQSKAKQSKAKQSKAKQSKAKHVAHGGEDKGQRQKSRRGRGFALRVGRLVRAPLLSEDYCKGGPVLVVYILI
jgi:hypothetical protein